MSPGNLKVQAAVRVDLEQLFCLESGSHSTADSAASPAQSKQQLYGKSICYCSSTAMYVASLGNAADEDQNVTWLMRVNSGGTSIGQVSAVHVSAPPAAESATDEPTSASAQAALQHPDPESEAEHTGTDEEDDDSEDDDAEEADEENSEAGNGNHVILPSIDRSYVVHLLPASRQEMQSPALVLGVPSHGLPGVVATVFESAHSNGSGCALVAQIQELQVSLLQTSVEQQLACPACHTAIDKSVKM